MMSHPQASSRPRALVLTLAGLAAALPATSMGMRNLAALGAGELPNPDSAMRLVRLHDILQAGAPVHAVLRDGSGAGTMLHWSHLLDALAVVAAAPLAAVAGWHAALHAVAVASGPLGLFALGAAIAWAAWPLGGAGWGVVAALMAGAAPMVGAYGLPGVFHHHILLAAAVAMAWGWSLRLLRDEAEPVSGGVALGAWTGAGLWLSPETLPFSLMGFGVLWAAWLGTPEDAPRDAPKERLARGLLAASLAFLVVTTAAWLADPPAAGLLAREADRLSLPFVALALGAVLPAWAARYGCGRVTVLACVVLAGGAWAASAAPPLGGLDALMSKEEAEAFFGKITEMEPIQDLSEAVQALLGGVFAALLLSGLALAERRRPGRALPVAFAAVCAVCMVLLTARHVRFSAYPTVLGAMLLPGALAALSRAQVPPLLGMAGRMGLVLPLLLGPFLAPAAAGASAKSSRHECKPAGALALAQGHDGEVVLADVNLTPALLYGSGVRTIGSLYHRNAAGFMRLRSAWLEAPGTVPGPAFRATGATLVLACPGNAGPLWNGVRGNLADAVSRGEPPPWLSRIADAGPGGFVLYRLVD